MVETTTAVSQLRWHQLSADCREDLRGKLVGLWESVDDEVAFESLSVPAQQALLLILDRLKAESLWQMIKRISNVWGEGGVGFEFTAWPVLHSTLSRRRDFQRRFANHRDTDGGFFERGRARSVMHFLYVEGNPRRWSLHFDLYNPLHSPVTAWRHYRHEVVSKVKPDWQVIQQGLKA